MDVVIIIRFDDSFLYGILLKYCFTCSPSSTTCPNFPDTLPLASADDAIRVYNVEGDFSARSQPVLFQSQ